MQSLLEKIRQLKWSQVAEKWVSVPDCSRTADKRTKFVIYVQNSALLPRNNVHVSGNYVIRRLCRVTELGINVSGQYVGLLLVIVG